MPGVYWDNAVGNYVGANVSFATPRTAKRGDTLFVVMTLVTGTALTLPDGWAIDFSTPVVALGETLHVIRRTVVEEEPATHVFITTGLLVPVPLALMLLYRGLDVAAAFVASAVSSIGVSTNYPAPTITLTTYSDLTLCIYHSRDAAGTATFVLPAGVTQRGPTLHGSGGGGGGTLVVAEFQKEDVGATGAKAATCSVAVIGLAAQSAFKSYPTLPAPSIVPDVAGAIGLVSEGV